MRSSSHWKRSLLLAALVLLAVSVTTAASTFAWYTFQARAHSTRVHLAAGTTTVLQIADSYDGSYSSSVRLGSFQRLNPVSTNDILAGFRKVQGFTGGGSNYLVARWFGDASGEDYFSTSLYLRTRGNPLEVYISSVSFENAEPENPVSSAVRLGIVVYAPGRDGETVGQYIFEIDPDTHILSPDYNTYAGAEGTVLDLHSSDPDAVTAFTPYTSRNFWEYHQDAEYNPPPGAECLKICDLPISEGQLYGESVRVDVYLWLEGCDQDCTNDIVTGTMSDFALSFAGYYRQ